MSDITEQIRDHLARQADEGGKQRLYEAQERQRQIAAQNQNRRSIDGVGRPAMEVDTQVYQEWIRKEGKEIWKDPAFRKRMARENPELVVRSQGTGKVQVGYGS